MFVTHTHKNVVSMLFVCLVSQKLEYMLKGHNKVFSVEEEVKFHFDAELAL